MPLHQPYHIPERILSFGPAGASKSTGWLNIAKFAALTGSDAQFYVLDTDAAVPRMIGSPTSAYKMIQDRVHTSVGYDWNDYTLFQKMVARTARPQDWVVVDFIGNAWSTVQQHFVEGVFNKNVGDYFMFQRKADAKALEGWTDWNVINALYRDFMNPLTFKGNYHLYCTAKSEPLSGGNKPTESAAVRNLFLPYGQKPVGQKDLPFAFHTVLLNGKTQIVGQPAKWTLTTVKDRERQEVAGLEVSNFTIDYLVNIGGWEVG